MGSPVRGEGPLRISAEERDALYSQAMDLLSGNGVRQDGIDPVFSEDLRRLLEALGEIGEGRTVELTLPSEVLRRVMSGIRDRLPECPGESWRSARTGLVAETCDRVLAQLEEERRSA